MQSLLSSVMVYINEYVIWGICVVVAVASVRHGIKELRLKTKTELSDYLFDLISVVDGWGADERGRVENHLQVERAGAIALIGVLGRDYLFLRPVCRNFLLRSQSRLSESYYTDESGAVIRDFTKVRIGSKFQLVEGLGDEVTIALTMIENKRIKSKMLNLWGSFVAIRTMLFNHMCDHRIGSFRIITQARDVPD